MPLLAPNLDDRRFADIVAEAKTLIPRYAPEWTNHHDSDPGITLIHLFAWMTDMLLYRLNQVPDRNYIKFLQLLGIELKPAQPARAELTFTLARNDIESVIVPKETQVAVAGGGEDGPPPVFQTDEALIALGAKLVAVQAFDGFGYTAETTKNDTIGQWFYPFGANAREGGALLLGFDSPLAFTKQQVNLMVYIHTDGLQPEGRHCDLDLSGLPVPATLVWEYWDRKAWLPISLDKDETRAFTRSGHVYFRGPGDGAKKDKLGDVDQDLYWIRCRLARNTYERPPRLDSVLINTVSASQVVTVRHEVLGGSDGRPNQTFRLANAPVVVRDRPQTVTGADNTPVTITSLRLEVEEGNGFQVWQEVSDFYASGPDDPHYVLNRTTGEIHLGDGQHGRVAVASALNPNTSIVAREYLTGGGKRGIVGADTITGLQTFVPFVDSVTNKRPSYGGSDEESLAEAKLRAPLALKSKDRAVTVEDFEYMARETPGVRVRRAKALPLFHPEFRGAPIPGVVTVIVVPDSDAPNPMPSEATLRIVCEHLNKHRLLTSEVHVVGPRYCKIKIEADIVARFDADLAELKRQIEDGLTTYFHPLKGGENQTGWEFGRTVYYSEVYRVLLQTPGVDRVENNQLIIWLEDEQQPFCRDVPIAEDALLYSDQHDIRVMYQSRS